MSAITGPKRRKLPNPDHQRLTRREREAIALAREGKRNKEIAQIMGITEDTAKNYIVTGRAKAGAK